MSSGVFRGKESSNRIELSQLVQDIEFLCFGFPAALGRGQVGRGCLGELWVSQHVHTCMHTHANGCIEIAYGCRHGGIHVYDV